MISRQGQSLRRPAPVYGLAGAIMADGIVHEKATEGQFVKRPGGEKTKDEALLTYVMHTPQLMEMGETPPMEEGMK